MEVQEQEVIDFTSTGKYLYHTITKQEDGSYIITGWNPDGFGVGAQLFLNVGDYYNVDEVTFRDHKGVFIDPEKKKNSFFTAIAGKIWWSVEFNKGYKIRVSELTQERAESRAMSALRKAKGNNKSLTDTKIVTINRK